MDTEKLKNIRILNISKTRINWILAIFGVLMGILGSAVFVMASSSMSKDALTPEMPKEFQNESSAVNSESIVSISKQGIYTKHMPVGAVESPKLPSKNILGYPLKIIVDQAEPYMADIKGGNYKFVKLENALLNSYPGQTIYLCPGHIMATTINQNVNLLPVDDASLCFLGDSYPGVDSILEPIPRLKGDLCLDGGYDCNHCVKDIRQQFETLPESRKNEYSIDLTGHDTPPFFTTWSGSTGIEFHGHWQGVQRLPNNEPYLVVSRDLIEHQGKDWSGFVLVRDSKVLSTTVISHENYHPSGFQVVGDVQTIGTDKIVNFIDISDPFTPLVMGNLPDRVHYDSSATAITRLQDGRYLVAVFDSGKKFFDFHLSNFNSSDSLFGNPAAFSKIDRVTASEIKLMGGPFEEKKIDKFQNINLLTDCNGDIYLLGTANRRLLDVDGKPVPTDEDWAHLYRLDVNETEIEITKVAENKFPMDRRRYTPGFIDYLLEFLIVDEVLDVILWGLQGDYGNFHAAAGTYVDDHNKLYLYTTQHGWVWGTDGKRYTQMTEFGPKDGEGIQNFIRVETLPGSNAIMLIVDAVDLTYEYSKIIVYKSGEAIGEYIISPIEEKGVWLYDKIAFWESSLISNELRGTPKTTITSPPIGTTFYYTVTVQDRYGNESPPSDVISSTFGMIRLDIPDVSSPSGGSVDVPVTTPNAESLNICQANIWIEYDPSMLTPTGVTPSPLSIDYEWSTQVISPGLVTVFTSNTVVTELHGSGALFNLQFDVIGEDGFTSTISISGDESLIIDCAYPNSPLLIDVLDPAIFTASTNQNLGDLNGNGDVDYQDAALALQLAVSGDEPTETQMAVGNLNHDDRINAADAVLIMRQVAGLPQIPLASQISNIEASNVVTLSIPYSLEIAQGGSIWGPLDINDATNIAGIDVILSYNPYLISFTDARTTALSANFDLEFNEPIPGQIWLALKPKAGYEDGLDSGSGSLIEIEFEDSAHAQENATIPLNLILANLSDRYGRYFELSNLQIEVDLVDGSLIVQDNLPPYLVLADPPNGSYIAELDNEISIEFNESMDHGNLDVQSTPELDLIPSWNDTDNIVTLGHEGLMENTVYTFSVMAADVTGIPMTQTVSWVFTTTVEDNIIPTVISVLPEDKSIGVELKPTIQITFSEKMAPNYFDISVIPDDFDTYEIDLISNILWNEDRKAITTTVEYPFVHNTTYTITIQASDRYGNRLPELFTWSFTTKFDLLNVYLPLIMR
jgi:hypothetical protein